MRTRPRKTTKLPSLAQESQRSKFKFANQFLNKFKDLINIGFLEEKRMSSRNVAMKELLNNGIIGKFPNWKIDYSKVRLSKGTTPVLPTLKMIFKKRNEVLLRWERAHFEFYDSADNDLVRVILYNATEGFYVVNEQAFRCDHQCYVQLPNWIKGDEVQVYVTVHSLKGAPSNSQYAGELIVA